MTTVKCCWCSENVLNSLIFPFFGISTSCGILFSPRSIYHLCSTQLLLRKSNSPDSASYVRSVSAPRAAGSWLLAQTRLPVCGTFSLESAYKSWRGTRMRSSPVSSTMRATPSLQVKIVHTNTHRVSDSHTCIWKPWTSKNVDLSALCQLCPSV